MEFSAQEPLAKFSVLDTRKLASFAQSNSYGCTTAEEKRASKWPIRKLIFLKSLITLAYLELSTCTDRKWSGQLSRMCALAPTFTCFYSSKGGTFPNKNVLLSWSSCWWRSAISTRTISATEISRLVTLFTSKSPFSH